MSNCLDDRYKELEHFLVTEKILNYVDYNLKWATYFKTGGIARYFILPHSQEAATALVKFLKSAGIDFKILGNTSNVVLLDEKYYGVIISTRNMSGLSVNWPFISVESGYLLADFCRVALINSAIGFEGLEGIPGSIGGALVMNAGAYGYKISDHLFDVTVIDDEGNVRILRKDDCHFAFRESIFKNGSCTILSARFALTHGAQSDIANRMEVFHIARHSYQEFSYPNLGSMISVKGDFYRAIFRRSKSYTILYFLLKLLLKNPISKFFSRKRPSNDFFNKLAIFYLRKSQYALGRAISHKSINILINDGKWNALTLENRIASMHEIFGTNFEVENEIVNGPVYEEK